MLSTSAPSACCQLMDTQAEGYPPWAAWWGFPAGSELCWRCLTWYQPVITAARGGELPTHRNLLRPSLTHACIYRNVSWRPPSVLSWTFSVFLLNIHKQQFEQVPQSDADGWISWCFRIQADPDGWYFTAWQVCFKMKAEAQANEDYISSHSGCLSSTIKPSLSHWLMLFTLIAPWTASYLSFSITSTKVVFFAGISLSVGRITWKLPGYITWGVDLLNQTPLPWC